MLKIHTSFFIILIALSMGNLAIAQSQPTLKNIEAPNPKRISGQSTQKNAISDQRSTEQAPLVVKVISLKEADDVAAKEEEEKKRRAAIETQQIDLTAKLSLYTLGLLLATIILAISTIGMWISTRRAADAAHKSADAALKNSGSLIAAERAYVKMSHCSLILMLKGGKFELLVDMQVKNNGRTPANITQIFLTTMALPSQQSWPIEPVYERKETSPTSQAFLVTNDKMYHKITFQLSNSDVSEIRAENKKFLLYGYVDYIDKFGARHRGGYARECYFDADDPANPNLKTIFVAQPKYNYDRLRVHGEGNDWDHKVS